MYKKAKWVAISLAVVLLGVLLVNMIGSNFGQVKIERLNLVDGDGYSLSAKILIPRTATAETPAPAMMLVPGGDTAADTMSNWGDELARRGYVVMMVDYSGVGDTEVNPKLEYFMAGGAMGLATAYDFLSGLHVVDSHNIGIGGHSMGSLYAYRLSTQREVSFVVSDVLYMDALPEYNFNFIQVSSLHDEGILSRINTFEDIYTDKFLCGVFGTDKIVPNQLYGSWEDRTARVFYTVNQTHQDNMVRGEYIERVLYGVMQATDAPVPIDSGNHIYHWKILSLFVALVGMGMFLFNMAGMLLETNTFGKLKLTGNRRVVGFAYKSKGWWLYAVCFAIAPLLVFFPGTALGRSLLASNSLFQLGSTPNGLVTWSVFSAVLMIVLFLVFHFKIGKKQGGSLSSYGISTVENKNKITFSYLLRSAIFSLILFLAAYFVLYLIFHYAKTDLHLWTESLRPLNAVRAAIFPWYFLLLIPFFAASMLAGSVLTFGSDDDSEGCALRKSVILGTLLSLSALILLWIFHHIWLRTSPYGAFTNVNFAQFFMTTLRTVILNFGFATALALYINKKTKSIFAGIFIGVAVVTFVFISGNALALVV